MQDRYKTVVYIYRKARGYVGIFELILEYSEEGTPNKYRITVELHLIVLLVYKVKVIPHYNLRFQFSDKNK